LFQAARDKFVKALAIKQQIRDRASEAATRHALASLDIREESYAAAGENLARALHMYQQIGNRAGEAAMWHQLGSLAVRMGQLDIGLRLLVLCLALEYSMDLTVAQKTSDELAAVAERLGYTTEQVWDILKHVIQAYSTDRGHSMLEGAFSGLSVAPADKTAEGERRP
jgi:hypothetical protein